MKKIKNDRIKYNIFKRYPFRRGFFPNFLCYSKLKKTENRKRKTQERKNENKFLKKERKNEREWGKE